MFTPGMGPLQLYKIRHEELLKEAEHHRLVQEALKAHAPKVSTRSKILAYVGNELVILGSRLQERYGIQPNVEIMLGEAKYSMKGRGPSFRSG